MTELWIKKTIYRRYLIDDNEVNEVILTIKGDPERAEELIEDIYDKNEDIEYDEEKIILPIDYNISALGNER